MLPGQGPSPEAAQLAVKALGLLQGLLACMLAFGEGVVGLVIWYADGREAAWGELKGPIAVMQMHRLYRQWSVHADIAVHEIRGRLCSHATRARDTPNLSTDVVCCRQQARGKGSGEVAHTCVWCERTGLLQLQAYGWELLADATGCIYLEHRLALRCAERSASPPYKFLVA